MTTLEFRTTDVKATADDSTRTSLPPGVFLMFVIVGVMFGLAAVSLLAM